MTCVFKTDNVVFVSFTLLQTLTTRQARKAAKRFEQTTKYQYNKSPEITIISWWPPNLRNGDLRLRRAHKPCYITKFDINIIFVLR